jgi:hypothetical protein
VLVRGAQRTRTKLAEDAGASGVLSRDVIFLLKERRGDGGFPRTVPLHEGQAIVDVGICCMSHADGIHVYHVKLLDF